MEAGIRSCECSKDLKKFKFGSCPMEAEVRSYEFSESRSLYDRLYRNNQGSLLLKFFEYLFQGEIIYLRGRLLISGGDIFICLCYSCVICLLPFFFLIANSYHLYMFLSSSKRGRLLEQDLFLSIILVLMITII